MTAGHFSSWFFFFSFRCRPGNQLVANQVRAFDSFFVCPSSVEIVSIAGAMNFALRRVKEV